MSGDLLAAESVVATFLPIDEPIFLGLVIGMHSLHHRIVGWAQGVVKVSSMPRRSVHGSFNQDIVELTVDSA